MTYPNVIFDMGGVLLDYDEVQLIGQFFSGLMPKEQLQIFKAVMGSGLWRRFDLGEFDDGAMIREVCALLPEHLHPRIEYMIPRFFEAMPPTAAGEFIPLLKARGQRVYLLSNVPYTFHREKHRIPHIGLFDGVLASCDVALVKPDPEIYQLLLRKFGLRAEDCFFIDDLRENIDGAAAVGIAGHCFADGNVERLRAVLEL